MTTNPPPSQAQGIEKIATKLMGWKKRYKTETNPYWYKYDKPVVYYYNWNPYTSEDDFRLVLDKVMEDEILWMKYCNKLCKNVGHGVEHHIIMKATLEQRINALLPLLP